MILRVAALLLLVVVFSGCVNGNPSAINNTTDDFGTPQVNPNETLPTYEVRIENLAFMPREIALSAGDSIRWVNMDSVSHTATADDGSFDTGILERGQSKIIVFDEAGEYTYHCTIHPQMTGKVIVQ